MKTSRSQALTPDESLRPWPPYKFVPVAEAADFLGVTEHWMKRARANGFIEFAKWRNTVVIRAAELYRLVDDHLVPARPPKQIRRPRTAAHNQKISAGVKAANAKRAAAKQSGT